MQQNWIQVLFLLIAATITWAAWVLFGVFATVNLVVGDFCQNISDVLQQRPGAQATLSCPDLAAAQASITEVFININQAVATANIAIDGVRLPLCSMRVCVIALALCVMRCVMHKHRGCLPRHGAGSDGRSRIAPYCVQAPTTPRFRPLRSLRCSVPASTTMDRAVTRL